MPQGDAQADLMERAREILREARKAADNDWMMNGIYPKRKQDTIDRHEEGAIATALAEARGAERDRCLRIMKSSTVFWTEDKIKYMREGLEPRSALASPAPQEETGSVGHEQQKHID